MNKMQRLESLLKFLYPSYPTGTEFQKKYLKNQKISDLPSDVSVSAELPRSVLRVSKRT